MAENIGKLITCDRCNESLFLRYTGTDHLDGGFTSVDKFEKKPDNWCHNYDLKMDLCPKCRIVFNDLIEKFKENA